MTTRGEKYETHKDAEELAAELLSAGASKMEAIAAVRDRFPEMSKWCNAVVTAVIARLIEEFELGAVEAWLSETMADNRESMCAQELARRESLLERAWLAYDTLTDPDATAKETVAAAKALDRALRLGWEKRLPNGALR